MGNENSQITFPIEGNNNLDKIRIKYKKIKSKEISKNNDKIISKQKNHIKQKTLKNYIVPRISTTPDRNINIPGLNKNSNNNKRYVSYEKQLKVMSGGNENKNNNKKKEISYKKINNKNNKFWKNTSMLNISNLLNSIYSYEIDNRFCKTNELYLSEKRNYFNATNKNFGISIFNMFDSLFKYNYFIKNRKQIIIKSNSNNKNKTNNSNKNHSHSPKKSEQNINYKNINLNKIVNDKKNIYTKSNNIKYIEKEKPNINININKKTINTNTTLILNKFDVEKEVISVNNKKKDNCNHINYNNKNLNKKYSESKYITESESESCFISQEEINLINNIPQIETNKIKSKEEDASESQTDKQQEIINHNITNKNKNNINYFVENSQFNPKSKNSNYIVSKNFENNNMNNNGNIYGLHKEKNKIENKNYKNLKINTDELIKSKIMDKDDEIILSSNESQNTTYLEILLAMNENKNESIIDDIKKNYINKKKFDKNKKVQNNKTCENQKQITPQNIPIKREITPPNIGNKRLTLNMAINKIPKNVITTNNVIINNTKKITPTKKLQINSNINDYGTKTNFHHKNFSIYNNSAFKHINNTINNNNVYSPKRITRNSGSKNKINNSNFSSIKKLDYKIQDKSNKNNNSPIVNFNNSNINGNQYINNIKNKKNSESISPSNSPDPSPTNHFNNNYKDKYAYKKMVQFNNSIRKKVNETNNISNQYSINTSNNNNIYGNDKSTTLYSKINTNNTTKRTNYNLINNKKMFRNSLNKNKIIFFKKERLSGNSFNNKIQKTNEVIENEQRTKSNDQKYTVYSSKIVLATTKKKLK